MSGFLLMAGMDAIDGKQARRVGMASALGEMFDHGCGEFGRNDILPAIPLMN